MASFHLEGWRKWSARLKSRRLLRPSTAVATDWLLSVALAALFSVCGFVWLLIAIVQAGFPLPDQQLTAWDAALFSFAGSFAVQAALRLGLI